METIKFDIIVENENMCRIVPNDFRNVYKIIADGSCICSLDVMLAEMKHIKEEVEKLGNEAAFTIL